MWRAECNAQTSSRPAQFQSGYSFSSAYAFSRYRQAEDQVYRTDNPGPDSRSDARHSSPSAA